VTTEEREALTGFVDGIQRILEKQHTSRTLKAGPYGWVGQALWRLHDLEKYIAEHAPKP
jgi:hypothetical protein